MVVEDGTGLIHADSFVSVEFASDYFSARNVSAWEALTEKEKEVLLIKATDFISNVFRYVGRKLTAEQPLSFPRIELYDLDGYEVTGVPLRIKQAVCEAVTVMMDDEELFQKEEAAGALTSERIETLSFSYDPAVKIKGASLWDSINSRLSGLYIDQNKRRLVSSRIERV